MLIKLMDGVRYFKNTSFKAMQVIFEQLIAGQHPDIFFITCSDSRVIPSLMTQSKPGDMFVIRNVGNIIPPNSIISSEAAAIEFAIQHLHIKDIIVCGHSDCGAIKGLLTPTTEKQLPMVYRWLTHSHAVLKEMNKEYAELDDFPLKLKIATKKNVLAQIEHLKTYPIIKEKLAHKALALHAWFYEFESGEIFIYNAKYNEFINFESSLKLSIEERSNHIVQEMAMNYLEQFTHPKTANEYHILMRFFEKIEEDLTVIWEKINKTVEQRLWNELGGFYSSPMDPEFTDLVANSAKCKLENLKDFQRNVFKSEGYHEVRGQIMRRYCFLKPILPIVPEGICTSLERYII